jgi:hypothetical protein
MDGTAPPAPGARQQAEVDCRSVCVEEGPHTPQSLARRVELAPEDRVDDELAVACREEVELPRVAALEAYRQRDETTAGERLAVPPSGRGVSGSS